MKQDDILKLSEQALSQLADALERGQSDSMLAYLKTLSRFHNYSFGNVLLIAFQCPNASQVAGFHAWKKLGRFVRKGERGICILAPMVYRGKCDSTNQQNGDASEQNELKRIYGFRCARVFDVSQTDGEPLPTPASVNGSPGEHLAALLKAISAQGIAIRYDDLPAGVLGVSMGGTIVVQPQLPAVDEFLTLLHELAHEIMHRNKDGNGLDSRPDKNIRELEAEAVAFVVSNAFNVDSTTHSSDYIQLYTKDREALNCSLQRIQQTAITIIRSIEEQS